jgi:hypothetical protein
MKFVLLLCLLIIIEKTRAQEPEVTVERGILEPTRIDERTPHLGILLGTFDPDSGYLQSSTYGLQFGLKPFYGLKIGVEFSRSVSKNEIENRHELDRTLLLFNMSLSSSDIHNITNNWHVGLGVGPSLDSFGNITILRFAAYPYVGVDIPIGTSQLDRDIFTIGARLGYLVVTENYASGVSATALLKYWL